MYGKQDVITVLKRLIWLNLEANDAQFFFEVWRQLSLHWKKKLTKKYDARAKLLFFQFKPIAFLPFSLTSPSLLLNPFPTRVKYTQWPAAIVRRFSMVFLNIFLQRRLLRAAFLFPITFAVKVAYARVPISENFNWCFSGHSLLPWLSHHFGKNTEQHNNSKVRASDISWKKKTKFCGIFRDKFAEKSANFVGFSQEKSQISQKYWPILRDFRGKKSNFEGFSGVNS